MIVLGIPLRWRKLMAFTIDVVLALVALYLAHIFRLGDGGFGQLRLWNILDVTTGASTLFIFVHMLMLYVTGGYELDQDFRNPANLVRLWIGIAAGFLLLMAVFYAIPNWSWGRGVSGIAALTFGLLLTGWRLLLQIIDGSPVRQRRVLIVGGDKAGALVATSVLDSREHRSRYRIVGWVDDQQGEPLASGLTRLGTLDELELVVGRERVDMVIVALSHLSGDVTSRLLTLKARRGLSVVDVPTIYKALTGRVPIEHMADTWVLFGPDFAGRGPSAAAVTRIVDVVVSSVGLIFGGPIMAIAGIGIWLSDRGPMFYSQERLGIGERPFTIIKMRTMYVDAEKRSGAVWSQGPKDPRVTPIGRFLRRSRIDELPQLWNVIRGDMSLVGPRPEREHFVRQLEQTIPFYALRFAVRPGVTGWAQVMYRYGASVEDAKAKLEYELYAVQEMSPALYVMIMLKTAQTVLFKPGS